MSDDLSIPSPTYRVPNHRRYGGADPALRRLLIYAAGLVALGAVIGGVSLLFNRHSGPVPVVQADPRPVRVKPENPGGMQISGLGVDASADGDKADRLAPPPEVPDPKALRVPPAAATAPTAPGATPAGSAPPVPPQASRAQGIPAQTGSAHAALPAAAAIPPSAGPSHPAVAAAARPAPAAAPTAVPANGVARTADSAAGTPANKPLPTAKPAAVQLAALGSEDAARQEWQRMAHRMPDLLSGRTPAISKVERDGHQYWRVRVTGFADVAAAKAFCERARGRNTSCSVADF